MKLWRAECNDIRPVLVECPSTCRTMIGCTDSDGVTIFINTHFDTEDQAWDNLVSDAKAWVRLAGRDIKEAKSRLARARKGAGDAAERYVEVQRGVEAFRRSKPTICGQACDHARYSDEGRTKCPDCGCPL